MGRVCVTSFVSLDGVVQAPLDADEDRDGGFDRGGWVPPRSDDVVDRFREDTTAAAGGLLLGRRTYDIMAAAWAHADESDPAVAAMNRMPKHVVTSSDLSGTWPGSTAVTGDLASGVERVTSQVDGDLVVFGSAALVRGLSTLDLVDEYRLLRFPLVLGAGKRMIDDSAVPASFVLIANVATPSGGGHPHAAPHERRGRQNRRSVGEDDGEDRGVHVPERRRIRRGPGR